MPKSEVKGGVLMANKNETYQDQLIEKIRENYLSIALGLLVLLVAVSIVFRANDSMTQKRSEEAEQKTTQKEYTVKKGESVSSIARDQLGSMDYTDEIVKANQLENPEKIEVGQKLVLPDVTSQSEVTENENDDETQETPAPTAMSSAKGDLNGAGVTTTAPGTKITGNTYTIQKGDTLFNITVRAYNNSRMMWTVMKANHIRNANYIQAGMTLTLPR